MRKGALGIFLLLAGCASQERSLPSSEAVLTQQGQTGALGARKLTASENAQLVLPSSARMIIRTADISLVVDNAAIALDRVITLIESMGGYIAEQRQWQVDGQVAANVRLRVPAEQLTSVLAAIRKDAIRVRSENIKGEDVSEEFSDLGARLTNLKATESELRQLLATVRERTQKASEVLEVHRELAGIRSEIDRIQGRMDFLKQMTAMSTINLELIPDALSDPIIEPGWRPIAIAKTATRSLVASLKWIATAVIWLVIFVAPLLLLFVVFVLVLRKVLAKPLERLRANPVPPQNPRPGDEIGR